MWLTWIGADEAITALLLPLVATLVGVLLAEFLAISHRRRLEKRDAQNAAEEASRLTTRSYGLLAATIQSNDPELRRAVASLSHRTEWITPFSLESQVWANVSATLLVNDRENYLLHASLDRYFARATAVTKAVGAFEATLRAFTSASGSGTRPFNDLLEAIDAHGNEIAEEAWNLKQEGDKLTKKLQPLLETKQPPPEANLSASTR